MSSRKQKQFGDVLNWFPCRCYNTLDCHGEAFVLNFNILVLVAYAITVMYLAQSKKYIRLRTPDEEDH
jgi:hypothetical protein